MRITDKADMRNSIREITGQKTWTLTGCKKSKSDSLIIEKEKYRWEEYGGELFHHERGKPLILKNMGKPEMLFWSDISTGQDEQEQSSKTR